MITFRSFTVKHGVIKQMNIDSPKFENLIDQAFIFIHEQFVDGKFDPSMGPVNLFIYYLFIFFCFVALRPKSTAMVIAGRSVHLTTLFPGQA